MNRYLFSLTFFTVIILSILSFSCTKHEDKPFRIGIATWVGFGPFYVAQEKGFFSEQGLNVDIKRIDDFGSLRSALVSGDLDGIVQTIDSWASGASEGLPAVCVLKVDESFGADGVVVRKKCQFYEGSERKSHSFS
jgi:NitT/TauT family transport system substrate-binding protein